VRKPSPPGGRSRQIVRVPLSRSAIEQFREALAHVKHESAKSR